MSKKILLVGGGGHCKSVLDSLLTTGHYSEIGIIDKKENVGKCILDVPIIGCDDDLLELYSSGYAHAFITVGSIGDPVNRVRLFAELVRIGFHVPSILDSTVIISKYVNLAEGIYVGKNVIINAGSSIEKGAIINTSSTIEHDCHIGEFSHIAPGAVLCGGVVIGKYTHVGANSVVKQQINIGANTTVGIGSVVLHDLADNVVAFGNPCKEVGTR